MEKIKINGKQYLIDIEKCEKEGYLIKETEYPKCWEELVWFLAPKASLVGYEYCYDPETFMSDNEKTALDAFKKIINLRDWWWDHMCDGWRPPKDICKNHIFLSTIEVVDGEVVCRDGICSSNTILTFPDVKNKCLFFAQYKKLIEEAKMFL